MAASIVGADAGNHGHNTGKPAQIEVYRKRGQCTVAVQNAKGSPMPILTKEGVVKRWRNIDSAIAYAIKTCGFCPVVNVHLGS